MHLHDLAFDGARTALARRGVRLPPPGRVTLEER